MKKLAYLVIFFAIYLVLLLSFKNYEAEAREAVLALGGLTGGCAGCLDKIDTETASGVTTTGSIAFAHDPSGETFYIYKLTDSGKNEDSPYVIKGDTQTANKRWELVKHHYISGSSLFNLANFIASLGYTHSSGLSPYVLSSINAGVSDYPYKKTSGTSEVLYLNSAGSLTSLTNYRYCASGESPQQIIDEMYASNATPFTLHMGPGEFTGITMIDHMHLKGSGVSVTVLVPPVVAAGGYNSVIMLPKESGTVSDLSVLTSGTDRCIGQDNANSGDIILRNLYLSSDYDCVFSAVGGTDMLIYDVDMSTAYDGIALTSSSKVDRVVKIYDTDIELRDSQVNVMRGIVTSSGTSPVYMFGGSISSVTGINTAESMDGVDAPGYLYGVDIWLHNLGAGTVTGIDSNTTIIGGNIYVNSGSGTERSFSSGGTAYGTGMPDHAHFTRGYYYKTDGNGTGLVVLTTNAVQVGASDVVFETNRTGASVLNLSTGQTANLSGSSTSVATPTDNSHAVNKAYVDRHDPASVAASFGYEAKSGDTIFIPGSPFAWTLSGGSVMQCSDGTTGVSIFMAGAIGIQPDQTGNHALLSISGAGTSVYNASGTTVIAAGKGLLFKLVKLATAGVSNVTAQLFGTKD